MYKIIVKNDINKIWCIESINLASYLFHGLIAIVKEPDSANMSTIYLNNDEDIYNSQRSAI